jgi:uncharacterized repeat protein (TIGR02543 family)
VTLTAAPAIGNTFDGWSGDCAGTGNCQFTMDADKTATAGFTGPPPTLTVTAPNGGEVWQGGTSHTISWTFTGNPGASVKLELLKGGLLDSTISASAPAGSSGSGSFSWNIPPGQATASNYRVRVSSTTTAATDTSDADFTIRRSFTLTVSKSGTGTGTVSSAVGIDCGSTCTALVADGASVTLTAAPAIGNTFDGWSGDCAGTGNCQFTMDADKTATAGFTAPAVGITVTVPNGGEIWQAGTAQILRWTYTGSPGATVKIELLKAGVLNRTISAGTAIGSAGNGSFNWLIPSFQTLGNDYRIRVTSTSNAALTDTSDADFRINRAGIQVTAPNGGESWLTGTTQTIRWIYSGSVGTTVKIELLKNMVMNRTITSSTSVGSGGSGQFDWLIPDAQTPASDYKVRVTSNSSSFLADSSNANFAIVSGISSVTVSPPSPTLLTGQQQQFTATVVGGADQSVTWSVSGVNGGSAALGTIDATGLYTAPPVPPTPDPVTVKAAANVNPAKFGTASAQVNNPAPAITTLLPTQLDAGTGDTSLTVNGSGFNTLSAVKLGATSLVTTFVNSGQLTAAIPAAQLALAGTFPVTVVTPSPGGGTSGSANFQVLFVISVSPPSATPLSGSTQQFTATVHGTADTSVAWSIDGAGSGNSTVGTIDSAGLYTAPAVVPAPAGVTVRATSNGDNTKSASAAVTVTSIIEDWPKYRRDLANTGRSLETLIHSGNVSQLQKKWQFTTGTFGGSARVSASPAVATVGGIPTVYVGAWSGFFYAISADTGVQRWRYEVPRTGVTKCTATSRCRIASSPAVANGMVYFGAEDGYLYALNASDGTLVWRRQLGDTENGAEVWSSPAVSNGVVYAGVASHSSAPCVAGKMFAFNAANGTPVWTFDAIDQTSCASGTCLGAGIWSSPAIDEQFGTLWIGTGNAGMGCTPTTAQATRYPDGILALSAVSGTLKGFYQTMPNDITDGGDVGSSPALHQTRVVDECGNTDVTSYWVTVPSKDSKLWTAPRGDVGFLADPAFVLLDPSNAIASPAVQPFTQRQSCGVGKQLKTSGNDIYQPTGGGYLYGVRQQGSPNPQTPALNWTTLIKACANQGCPLFSAPASVTDLIFFGGGDGNFYAAKSDGTFLNPDGSKVFSFGTLGLVASGPAISNGRIYFGSYDGNVYCLSLNGQ